VLLTESEEELSMKIARSVSGMEKGAASKHGENKGLRCRVRKRTRENGHVEFVKRGVEVN
jgi:hypothetical protein